ncbi:MAG: geranylgeranylglyceryl/heptaprenylglyceryl phosphate synthase [Cyclobacteriaceae bacterium]|nr:geranylgeranylglyceryl/heptaprenylglyceryl phosphate synthase [Cyclobacteriaceae bacterium]
MTMILTSLVEKKENNLKSLSILIDPDKIKNQKSLGNLLDICEKFNVDFIFIGGSLLVNDTLNETVSYVKNNSEIPVILFPGSILHIDKSADAILFLSLISGRNPDLLIGQHVAAAPVLKNSTLEILSTGYILVGNDANTTVAHISQTFPIPTQKTEIAVCTAIAGEMLGMKLIYLDAGSGAKEEVPQDMIAQVKKSINIPLIVGGGIDTTAKANIAYQSGADMIVLGTSVEKNVAFVSEVAKLRDQMNS